MAKITIYDLVTELQTWIPFSKEILEKAKKSKITNLNNSHFEEIVDAWSCGVYDEDIDGLQIQLENLLTN